MFTPGAFKELEPAYRVTHPHVQVTRVGWASLGNPFFGRIRNLLCVGSDAQGLVLHIAPLLGGPRTLYIPWAHIRRAPNPILPISFVPRETFLLGPAGIPLTIPRGVLPRGA